MPDRPTPLPGGQLAGREVEAILAAGLQLIRERSDAVLNAVEDGIYVLDRQGETIFANEAAVRMLGFTLREMLGRPQHALIHHSRPDGSPFPIEECPIYHSVSHGIHERVGGDAFWRKDGRPLLVDYTSTPIKEGRTVVGAVITFRDVTERQLARERGAELERERDALRERDRALSEARAARAMLEQVFEHVPASVSMTQGAEHRIVLANARARELAGARTMLGLTLREAFPDLAGQQAVALLDQVLASGEPVAMRDLAVEWDRDGDGTRHRATFDVSYLPVRGADGRVTGVLTYSTESEAGSA